MSRKHDFDDILTTPTRCCRGYELGYRGAILAKQFGISPPELAKKTGSSEVDMGHVRVKRAWFRLFGLLTTQGIDSWESHGKAHEKSGIGMGI